MPPKRKNRSHLPVIPHIHGVYGLEREMGFYPLYTYSLINNNDDAKQEKKNPTENDIIIR